MPCGDQVLQEERKERGLGYVDSDDDGDDDDDDDNIVDGDSDEDDTESEENDDNRTVTLQQVQNFLQQSGYDIPMIDMMKKKSMENLLAVSLMTLEDCVSNPIGSRIKIRNDARNHIASTKVDRPLHFKLVCWINLLKAFRADKDEVLERLNAMRLDLERHALIKCCRYHGGLDTPYFICGTQASTLKIADAPHLKVPERTDSRNSFDDLKECLLKRAAEIFSFAPKEWRHVHDGLPETKMIQWRNFFDKQSCLDRKH